MSKRNEESAPVEWVDPPENAAGTPRTHVWFKVAEELRRNPERWAKISTRTTRNAAGAFAFLRVKRGTGAFAPMGSFEAVTRANSSGSFDVYARYVGEPK